MRVLVVYGSKRGGTAGLAEMVGQALREHGLDAEVRPARETAPDLRSFDAVIVGGALYMNRWHRDARRFVKRHSAQLRATPVWLFSSGPLDDSAARTTIAPVEQVSQAMGWISARGHATFGGRLAPDAKGFPARAMAKTRAGDWRDEVLVGRWVAEIVADLLQHGAASNVGGA